MKKFIYCALIALITISCEQIEDPWENSIDIPKTLSAYTPEFESQGSGSKSRALAEYLPESWDKLSIPHTRTYAVINPDQANEYIQYWSTGDAISVFFTTANLKYTLSDFKDEDGNGDYEEDYGKFVSDGAAVSGTVLNIDSYYAVYPYKANTSINYESGEITYNFPKTQHYNNDSYANGENGMIAKELKSEYDEVLYFQNFCSYLQLRLFAEQEQSKIVKQITLTSNNPNDKIAGEAAINFYGNAPVVNMKMTAGNQIILDCGDGVELSQDVDNPTKFWFVLPGDITFTGGFSITVTFNDNSYFEKSTTKAISIKRSHIKPMAPFGPENDDDIIITGPIRYKYEDTSIMEPYPLNNTFYGEDGQQLKIIDQVYDEETEEWVVLLSGTLKTIGGNSFTEFEPDIEYIKIDNDDMSPIVVSEFAFYNCTAETINIYNNVESVKESAFENANTTSLYIDGDVTAFGTNVGSGSFLEEIIVTGNVATFEEFAFASCMDLQTVEFNSADAIGYRAFYQCRGLSEIDLSTVKYIDDGAFRSCTSLQTVALNSVITIGDNAFMACSKLTSVEISNVCTMIGEGAFCNASRLQKVTCHAILPPFIKTDNTDGSYVFDGTHKNLIIYIPDGSMGDYTDLNYFVNNPSGYNPPVQATVNWWYQEYTGKLQVMQ